MGKSTLTIGERNLLKVAERFCRHSKRSAYSTAQLLLGDDERTPQSHTFHSRLNNDGSPLQLCLTASPESSRLRLLGDPGSEIPDPVSRHFHARNALRR